MAPQITQVAPKGLHCHLYAHAILRTPFQGRFRSTPGHHFGRFWGLLGSKMMDFGRILNTFKSEFRYKFGPSLCTVLRKTISPSITFRLPIRRTLLGRHLLKTNGYFAIGAGVVQNSARHGKNQNSSTQQRLCVGHLPKHT